MPQLQFLGSGDAFSSGGRLQACLHLSGGPEPLLLDCGATSLAALKRAEIDPASIGHIALSHLHGDHFAGIPWLLIDGQYGGRTQPLTIAGPPGTCQRLDETFEALYPGSSSAERDFELIVHELEDEATPLTLGPAHITAFAVEHGGGGPAYALRIEYASKVIAYSGDTEWTEGLVQASDGADLLVCECNFFEKEAPGHLNYRILAANRSHLNCERIVLTHMSQEMLDHRDEVELETVEDGTVITLDEQA